MASTFSTNLAIELIGTGDQAGTWGTTTNSNLGTLIEQAISGYVTQAVATGTDTTIDIPNGSTGVARNMYIELTGTGGTNTNLIVPANKKLYFIFNNSTGAVTVKVSGQTGVSVPTGKKMVLVSNGTDIVNGLNYIADFGTNSFTVTNLTATSATITNLIATSASITTVTNSPTFSAGTANGVAYLNGSKALTTGSALVFDGTNLGIGTASPGSLWSGANRLVVGSGSAAAGLTIYTSTSTAGTIAFGDGTTGSDPYVGYVQYNHTDNTMLLGTSGTTKATLDSSGNLGLGVTPSAWRSDQRVLQIGASASLQTNTSANDMIVNSNTYFDSTGTYKYIANGFATQYEQYLGLHKWWIAPSGTAGNSISFTQAMTLDSSGNLGLGVTPSAWPGQSASYYVSQFGNAAFYGVSTNESRMSANAYVDSGGTNRYISNGYATRYSQKDGAYIWLTAPSGTAGNAISFTQAMTLDASGNLGVGETSPGSYSKFVVRGGSGNFISYFGASTQTILGDNAGDKGQVGTVSNHPFIFITNATERARIDSSGNLGLGVTPSAWGSGWKSYTNQLYGEYYSTNGGYVGLASNAYYNGTNWIYKNTTRALRFESDIPNGAHVWYTAPSGTAGNAITFTQAMTLDASGNLGIGTTSPASRLNISTGEVTLVTYTSSRASGSYNTYNLGTSGTTLGYIGHAPQLVVGTSNNEFAIRAESALIFAAGGNTERARIDSSGNLLVGTTTAGAGVGYAVRLAVDGGGAEAGIFKTSAGTSAYSAVMWNTATSGDNLFVLFGTEGTITTRGSITYNRAGGAVAYNTTSDYRAKDIIGPVQNSGATIDALKVYMGKMKGATLERPMLIAHEAQEVAPYCVTGEKDAVNNDGTPKYQQMDVASLVPLLLAELQSLRARVAQLESKGA